MKKYLIYLLVFVIFSCDKIEIPVAEEYGKFDWIFFPGDPSNYPNYMILLIHQ